MDSIENLSAEKAAKRLKEMVEEIRVCMFYTGIADHEEQGRPMSASLVDESGSIWFITDKNSKKVQALQNKSATHLVFSHPGKEMYLDVTGNALISTDQEEIDACWTPLAKAWFPEGKTDPNICVIKIKCTTAKYWDTKHGKMLEFLKIITGALTGTKQGDGVSGQLSIAE